MDYQAIKPVSSQNKLLFYQLLGKMDWNGLRNWHYINTPWVSHDAVETYITEYIVEIAKHPSTLSSSLDTV